MTQQGRVFLAACGLALAATAGAGAQTKPPAEPPNPLLTVKTLDCKFPVATTATWKEGQAVAQTRTQEMQLTVENIDIQDATAELKGTGSRAYVSAVLSGWSLYFVDNGIGQLNITTVFAQEANPKKLKAVHSRHGYLQMQVGRYISEPAVSQNYGECEILQ